MRYLLSFLLLIAFVPVAHAVTVPTPDGTYTLISQTGGTQAEPLRVMKLVRYAARGDSQAIINSGEAVVYDQVSGDGVTVDLTTTSKDAAFAGIAATDINTADSNADNASDDLGRRNWGYIVVHGPAVVEVGGNNNAGAGDPFITSTDSTKVTGFEATTDLTSGAEGINGNGGFFLEAPGTSANSRVFVEAL